MNTIFPRNYPRSPKELIRDIVNMESQYSLHFTPTPLPKFKKVEIKWTPASLVGMAGNCLKALIP